MGRVSKAILLSLVALLLISMPVLAAVSYRAAYTIVESGGTTYDMLPTSVLVDNQWLADNGFLQDDALDTRIETLGGLVKPHMVATNKTLTAVPVPANSQTNLYFTTANSDLSSLDIITGYDGYITIDDAGDGATLEPGSDFEIEQSGYVDTDAGADKNLVFKEDAFRTYIDGADTISSTIDWGAPFPVVEALNGGNDIIDQLNHTVNLPAGIVAGDLLLVIFGADGNFEAVGWPGGWIELFEEQSLNSTLAVGYRVADGTEGATIVVTTVNIQMTAHSTYRISGYSGVPEAGAAAQGADINPNPPNLTPSWGARNTLWFALCEYDPGTLTVAAYPANYVDGQRNDRSNNVNGCGLGTAHRELNAVSEDPGTFTLSVANTWITNTVAIAPADLTVTATAITSDEYTVKTYGVDNEPAWATGDVLHFTGAATSNVNAGAINDNIAKLWVSLWFRLDSTFSAASATDQFIWGKFNGAGDYVYAYLEADDGILYFQFDDGVNPFSLESTTVSWTANTWYHIIASLSDTGPAQRLLVNGTAQDTDAVVASNTPNGGDFVFGDFDDPGAITGFIGEIQNVVIGIDNLTAGEETALYAGTAPGDETDYWYTDEGIGTAITSYGSAANVGTVDAAPTWETATFTTGSTGRLCDFYIEVDDGVLDPDRWGANLKGASVSPNANDWLLNQNNVMPYMDYYKHTVGGVEHAWYQPNYMIDATDSGGTETAGGSAVLITAAEITEGVDYWVGGLVTITAAAGAAPEGESRVCTASAVGSITVAPAFSANVDIGDTFIVDFGTLIDRSYYVLEFDGAGDWVDCGDDVSLDVTNITILAWFNASAITLEEIACRDDGANRNYYLAVQDVAGSKYLNGGVWIGGVGSGDQTADTIAEDTWYLGGVTYDGANIQIYLNGFANGAPTVAVGDIDNDDVSFTIGAREDGADRVFEGVIDEVMVYNTALTPAEMLGEWNAGVGTYTPVTTTGLVGHWHIEEGSGATITDSSGEGNTGTITGAIFANGFVPRPVGNAGTNDSRLTWGVNPTGIGVTLGGMVSVGQPTLGSLASDPAQDILPETEVSDWFIEPAVGIGGALLTNPLRPFVTMLSDNSTLTELQSWRLLAFAMILLVTVATSLSVGRHQGITAIVAGAALLGVVVLTIFPMWALVFAIGMFIGGLVMERSPSL